MSDAPLLRVERALRRCTVSLPFLTGLAAAARVNLDTRVPTMGVFASGRMVANPTFVASLNEADLGFVVAHELLHLALRTHARARGSNLMQFNIAHDYIINDILRHELGVARIPAGGLDMADARLRSAEEILLELRRAARAQAADGASRQPVWQVGNSASQGGSGDSPEQDGDVLADALEREWFEASAADQRSLQKQIEQAARRGLQVAHARGRLPGSLLKQMGLEPGSSSQVVESRRGAYRAVAHLPLQRWIESVAMGPRTFERPARRSAGSAGVVLPGRRRESWTLNIVLDTSGSMTDELPRALGAIGDFCDSLGVDQVRLVQCDAAVTADELVEPQALARKRIDGWGGSDLSPALRHLALDPLVRAVVVITDGDILMPDECMPYELLWLLPPESRPGFNPMQGRVLHLDPREA